MKFVDVFQFCNYLSEEMYRCNCFSTGRRKIGYALERSLLALPPSPLVLLLTLWVEFPVLIVIGPRPESVQGACSLIQHAVKGVGGQRIRPRPSSGLSKRNCAKFRELSLNFPKLADWLSIGRPRCLAAQWREFSN